MKAYFLIIMAIYFIVLPEITIKLSQKINTVSTKAITYYANDKSSTALFTNFNQYLSKRLLEN